MFRVVLGVALAVAFVAAVTPALEDARATRTERLAARELGRVETAARSLVAEEDPGARRVLTVSLPGDSPTEAPLSFLALGGVPGRATEEGPTDTADRDLLAYQVTGGRPHVRQIGVDLRVVGEQGSLESDDRPLAPHDRSLVLHGGQTYRLTLELARIDRQLTVVVRAKIR